MPKKETSRRGRLPTRQLGSHHPNPSVGDRRHPVFPFGGVENSEQSVSVRTTRLHNIAGKYTGKDDPVALARVQGSFPATGEIVAPPTTSAPTWPGSCSAATADR